LGDAKWYEKISTVSLIASIAGIGLAPLWLSNTISVSLKPIIEQLTMNIVK
jgi:NADH-quinone oxidoreductase subunit M